jgi:DNA polymerase-3 subunit alpha
VATLEDFAGSTEAIVFPDQLEAIQPVLKPDAVVFVEGAVDRRREEPSIRTARVIPIEEARREFAREIVIRLRSAEEPLRSLMTIQQLCDAHRGTCPLYFEIRSPEGWVATVKGRSCAAVDPSRTFLQDVRKLADVESVLCCGPRGAI